MCVWLGGVGVVIKMKINSSKIRGRSSVQAFKSARIFSTISAISIDAIGVPISIGKIDELIGMIESFSIGKIDEIGATVGIERPISIGKIDENGEGCEAIHAAMVTATSSPAKCARTMG